MGKFSDALEKAQKENKTNQDNTMAVGESSKGADSISKIQAICSDFNEGEQDKKLVVLHQPQTFEAEQFRTLKTNLLFAKDGVPPRTIMITSAVPDEGKSFVASNLAITIAQSVDKHVLLMDCDLRLPTIHQMFGLKNDALGLSNLLNGEIDVQDALHKTIVDKLTILPGGKQPHNPTELLSSEKMSNLLKEVKKRYDDRFIVIDSPPPTLTAETLALSRQVDGILIVVRHESTSRKAVKEMIEHIDKEKILGVIVNRYDVRLSKYYGYGKYGTYYGKK